MNERSARGAVLAALGDGVVSPGPSDRVAGGVMMRLGLKLIPSSQRA